MKKLTKTQLNERDKLAKDLRDSTTELNAEIEKYNAALNAAKPDLEAAITKHNETLSAVRDWRDNIVSEMENYEGERSEKWSESDAASEFQDWKGEFENLEPIDDIEIELPEELELVEEEAADAVDQLPESAGG